MASVLLEKSATVRYIFSFSAYMNTSRTIKGLLSLAIVMAVLMTTGCFNNPPKQSGVFVTHDDGAAWNAAPDLKAKNAKKPREYPPLKVNAVGVSPIDANIVVAGTNEELFRTTDGGKAWEKLNKKLPTANQNISTQTVAFHPTKKETYYVGGVSAGYGKVFKTGDGGNSLEDVFTVSRPGQTVTAIQLDPGGSDTVYVGDQLGAVYKSTDAGATWRKVLTVQQAVTSFVMISNNLYVGTAGQGVWRSTDGGVNFAPVNNGLTGEQQNVWVLTAGFGNLYAGTDNGPVLSRDQGNTWQPLQNPFPANGIRVLGLTVTGDSIYYAANAVVYKVPASGAPFTSRQLKLVKNIYGLASSPADPGTIYAAGNNENDALQNRYGSGLPTLFGAGQ